MRLTNSRRLLAALAALALLAAACGDDDTGTTGGGGGGDGDQLVLGRILPETGSLSFLGPPMIEGVNLAIEDINEAGGVNGSDVELIEADETDDATRVREAAQRLLGEGVHAIIGAGASGQTQEIIQTLSDNEIPQCSPSNTSPVFTDQENADFYFRTVPPDEAVAPVIADAVIADGAEDVAITARADDYGRALADLVEESLEESGANVTAKVVYNPDATTFDAEVGQITRGDPHAVVVIGFAEAAQLIQGLIERGVEPGDLYGADGVFTSTLDEEVDPANPDAIDGMKVVGASGGEEFNTRLLEETEDLIYGGQAYDCTVILALAAQAAGSTDGAAILAEVANVTQGGEECETFEACKQLLEDGEDIDYEGVSGPLNLTEAGDPTFARYAIAQFSGGDLEVVSSQDVDLSEAQGGATTTTGAGGTTETTEGSGTTETTEGTEGTEGTETTPTTQGD